MLHACPAATAPVCLPQITMHCLQIGGMPAIASETAKFSGIRNGIGEHPAWWLAALVSGVAAPLSPITTVAGLAQDCIPSAGLPCKASMQHTQPSDNNKHQRLRPCHLSAATGPPHQSLAACGFQGAWGSRPIADGPRDYLRCPAVTSLSQTLPLLQMNFLWTCADSDIWDPENDAFLPLAYDHTNVVEGKQAARQALRERLGLTGWGDKPIIGVVTRLTAQKGRAALQHRCACGAGRPLACKCTCTVKGKLARGGIVVGRVASLTAHKGGAALRMELAEGLQALTVIGTVTLLAFRTGEQHCGVGKQRFALGHAAKPCIFTKQLADPQI